MPVENKLHKMITLLLQHVVRGKQGEAKIILQKNPGLLMLKGDATDTKGRTFYKLSAWQYMLWAQDKGMSQMALACLPDGGAGLAIRKVLIEQYGEILAKGIKYDMGGEHYLDLEFERDMASVIVQVIKVVGPSDPWTKAITKAQRLLLVQKKILVVEDEDDKPECSISESQFLLIATTCAEAFKFDNSGLEEALKYAQAAVASSKMEGSEIDRYDACVCLMEILQLAGKATRDELVKRISVPGAVASGFFATLAAGGAGVSAIQGTLSFSLGTTSAEDFFTGATNIAAEIWREWESNPRCGAKDHHMEVVEKILDENKRKGSGSFIKL